LRLGFQISWAQLKNLRTVKLSWQQNENQNLDTRQRNNFCLPQANLTIYHKGIYYLGIKIVNSLPLEIKNVAVNQKKFKIALKKFYTLIHFMRWKSNLVSRNNQQNATL
jgi:hypothetical protein